MGQELFINSEELESKIRQLLPSQGGAGAGFDLSASTQIVPIVDLTESAEGSNIRQDLQSSLSFSKVTAFAVKATTTTIITTTGYWRIFGSNTVRGDSSSDRTILHILNDGSSDKTILQLYLENSTADNGYITDTFDYIIYLEAGDSFKITAPSASQSSGCVRQIATIDGILINP